MQRYFWEVFLGDVLSPVVLNNGWADTEKEAIADAKMITEYLDDLKGIAHKYQVFRVEGKIVASGPKRRK